MEKHAPVDLFDQEDLSEAQVKESVITALDLEEKKQETEEEKKESICSDLEQEDIQKESDIAEHEEAAVENQEADTYERLSKQIADLGDLFNKRIMHAEYEDKIIDQMHAELLKYRENLYAQLLRPVLLDIIEVRDSIMRIAENYRRKPEGEQNIPNKMFGDYAYDLQDILEKNNVEIYRENTGDAFVPVRHRAIKKEITHDASLHGKIAEALSCGYSYEGKVISAEKVSVYFYEEENEREDNVNG